MRRRNRSHLRGVTLIEVLIVVAIMALISTGVGFVVIVQMDKAVRKITTTRAHALKGVVTSHVAFGPGDCPTPDDLVTKGELEPDTRFDGWDQPFRVQCEGARITVYSNGPDRTADTEDDIIVPTSMVASLVK